MRRMAAEGGAFYLLRPHEVLLGQHIDLFVGRRVPGEGVVGSSLFVRIPPDSRAPTNQQVGHTLHTLHNVQLVMHGKLNTMHCTLCSAHLTHSAQILCR